MVIINNASGESPYNTEFVQKILNAHYNDKRVVIEASKLWESIE